MIRYSVDATPFHTDTRYKKCNKYCMMFHPNNHLDWTNHYLSTAKNDLEESPALVQIHKAKYQLH